MQILAVPKTGDVVLCNMIDFGNTAGNNESSEIARNLVSVIEKREVRQNNKTKNGRCGTIL